VRAVNNLFSAPNCVGRQRAPLVLAAGYKLLGGHVADLRVDLSGDPLRFGVPGSYDNPRGRGQHQVHDELRPLILWRRRP
jgi:hypothetical protein